MFVQYLGFCFCAMYFVCVCAAMYVAIYVHVYYGYFCTVYIVWAGVHITPPLKKYTTCKHLTDA